MRIGILTLPLHTNYGGILQAYALQTTLQHLGHVVYVFHHHWNSPKSSIGVRFKRYLRNFLRFVLKDRKTIIFPELYIKRYEKVFSAKIIRFIEQNINTITLEQLCSLPYQDYDAIIVGSDQIWRPQYFKKLWESPMEHAFLSFIPSGRVKKLSYAASLGTSEWEFSNDETTLCRQAVLDFDLITVREMEAVRLLKQKFKSASKPVLDPTFLLTPEDYNILLKNNNVKDSSLDIFAYILDTTKEIEDLIVNISKHKNFRIKKAGVKTIIQRNKVEENIKIGIEEWLASIKNCKLVITDSFHACVFSIIFNKPFIAIGNEKRGISRFKSLLSTFGLEDHLLLSSLVYDFEKSYEIPAESRMILKEKRMEALAILKNALN